MGKLTYKGQRPASDPIFKQVSIVIGGGVRPPSKKKQPKKWPKKGETRTNSP